MPLLEAPGEILCHSPFQVLEAPAFLGLWPRLAPSSASVVTLPSLILIVLFPLMRTLVITLGPTDNPG